MKAPMKTLPAAVGLALATGMLVAPTAQAAPARPASAPAAVPAARVARSVGISDSAAGCKSFCSCRATAAGSPLSKAVARALVSVLGAPALPA